MKTTFGTTKKGTWAYIQKSVRIDGKSTTKTVRRLGLLEDIRRKYGCQDPRQWVKDLAARMTEEEKAGRERISVDFYPGQTVGMGDLPLRAGGDLMLLPLYNRLGLPRMCAEIKKASKAKFDLDGILRTLVTGRLLFPCSKQRTLRKAQGLVRPPKFGEADMYRALSLLSGHIDDIQAGVYACSARFMERRDRVIYYDCTNYYFEIEDNDRDTVDIETGELVAGLRKRGKSKENRPSPIVQMGMFMDMDGIPLAFVVFPGNESEQATLRPLEDVLRRKFGLTEMVINDDVLGQEEKLDGFYAYATSLDDEATLVLKARSFHHEIEHLFRTTKTHLEARPVYLSRQDRIRSHFLVGFLALLLLKLLQKQLADSFPEAYKEHPLAVDQLIDTLQNLRFGQIQGLGYVPMFQRTSLTDQLQELAGVEVNKQIITKAAMNAFYRKVNRG